MASKSTKSGNKLTIKERFYLKFKKKNCPNCGTVLNLDKAGTIGEEYIFLCPACYQNYTLKYLVNRKNKSKFADITTSTCHQVREDFRRGK
jgi:predicted RNA-binding Zn-ribbon protein involved in translation (DUF1610 family)